MGINLGHAHIDLMHVLRAAGFRGGLKAVERRLGLRRFQSDGVVGSDAVTLWRRYREDGEIDSLRRLVVYNAEDALMLENLLVHAYNLSMSAFPLRAHIPPTDATAYAALLEKCSLTIE